MAAAESGLQARVQAPGSVARGEVFQVRTLVTHPMETGLRHDAAGHLIPRDIVKRFTCRYNERVVFTTNLHEAMAANPYLAFHLRATESGVLHFLWEADDGTRASLQMPITVEA